jgi:hypothetical protein
MEDVKSKIDPSGLMSRVCFDIPEPRRDKERDEVNG